MAGFEQAKQKMHTTRIGELIACLACVTSTVVDLEMKSRLPHGFGATLVGTAQSGVAGSRRCFVALASYLRQSLTETERMMLVTVLCSDEAKGSWTAAVIVPLMVLCDTLSLASADPMSVQSLTGVKRLLQQVRRHAAATDDRRFELAVRYAFLALALARPDDVTLDDSFDHERTMLAVLSDQAPQMHSAPLPEVQLAVALPNLLQDKAFFFGKYECVIDGQPARPPILCVLCGAALCSDQLHSLAHAKQHTGCTLMVFAITGGTISVFGNDIGFIDFPVYVDQHGEHDRELRRGTPLHLDHRALIRFISDAIMMTASSSPAFR
jgi:hypothetical protein